ncbi:MAG TPA: hypothetical protein VIN59_08405 [Alphaproteobacteria bacterium]
MRAIKTPWGPIYVGMTEAVLSVAIVAASAYGLSQYFTKHADHPSQFAQETVQSTVSGTCDQTKSDSKWCISQP